MAMWGLYPNGNVIEVNHFAIFVTKYSCVKVAVQSQKRALNDLKMIPKKVA